MYAGVPSSAPVFVTTRARPPPPPPRRRRSPAARRPPPQRSRASPKSVTRTRPSRPTSTFSGLKSRCTRPAACAAASPRPAARNTSTNLAPARAGVAAAATGERVALDELHRDEDALVQRARVVDGDDVGVRQARHRLGLAQQPRPALGARPRPPARQLERDAPIQLGIIRRVDHAHAAAPDRAQHLIAVDLRPRCQPPDERPPGAPGRAAAVREVGRRVCRQVGARRARRKVPLDHRSLPRPQTPPRNATTVPSSKHLLSLMSHRPQGAASRREMLMSS